ncbi:MAG: hypothetical protein HYS74_00090 [Parcubacteria group bacterium]|nr:hypothetical protein [Parcubacteria group bacterium]
MKKGVRLSREWYSTLTPVAGEGLFGGALCSEHYTPLATRSFNLRFVLGPNLLFANRVITTIEIVYCPVCHEGVSPLFTPSALERCISDGLRQGLVCAVQETAYFYFAPLSHVAAQEEG